jgi:hypothetical protein
VLFEMLVILDSRCSEIEILTLDEEVFAKKPQHTQVCEDF